MMHRMAPDPEGRQRLPELVRPMLAIAGELPTEDERWAYEFKWDGVRAGVYVEGGAPDSCHEMTWMSPPHTPRSSPKRWRHRQRLCIAGRDKP